MRTLFDKTGTAVAYFDSNFDIYSFNGDPLAYLSDAKVYTYDGKHIGWYIDGWIRDLKGYCVFFDESSTGGMPRPIKKTIPIKLPKKDKPRKKIKNIPNLQPVKRYAWSYRSNLDFLINVNI